MLSRLATFSFGVPESQRLGILIVVGHPRSEQLRHALSARKHGNSQREIRQFIAQRGKIVAKFGRTQGAMAGANRNRRNGIEPGSPQRQRWPSSHWLRCRTARESPSHRRREARGRRHSNACAIRSTSSIVRSPGRAPPHEPSPGFVRSRCRRLATRRPRICSKKVVRKQSKSICHASPTAAMPDRVLARTELR